MKSAITKNPTQTLELFTSHFGDTFFILPALTSSLIVGVDLLSLLKKYNILKMNHFTNAPKYSTNSGIKASIVDFLYCNF
ncbi:hypothetical protein [uncultured Roseivirga sp.]|uniref:hypothetical protein n=1 Tax=uncultured Roseivirga sp. TaxID=543088 RepID=UPI0030DBA6F9